MSAYNIYCIVNKKDFLQSFSDAVTNQGYERIPYAEWRKLSHAPCDQFKIIKNEQIKNIYIYEYVNGIQGEMLYANSYYKFVEDKTFLGFLIKHFGQKPMTTLNANKEISITGTSDLKNEDWLSMLDADEHTNLHDYYTNNYSDPYGYSVTTMPSYEWNNTIATTKIDSNAVIAALDLNNEKENKTMKTDNLFNFEFGPVSSAQFRMSPYGIAVSTNANGWVSYNAKTGEIFNVDILNFDISKMIYKMPVSLAGIAIGDILIHSGKPVFVRAVNSNGTVSVVNYADSTVVDILPIKNIFGFNFFTKVVSLIDFSQNTANPDNPFGNILPFLMLDNSKENNFDPLAFVFMMNGNNSNFFNNPMLLYYLMSEGANNKNNFLPFLLMNSSNDFNFLNNITLKKEKEKE